jgi:excisionase family DNA binding protein
MKTESVTVYPDRLLDKHEAAAWLNVSVSWLEKAAAARQIQFTKVGNHNRWSADDLAAIVEDGKQQVWHYEQPARSRLRAPA